MADEVHDLAVNFWVQVPGLLALFLDPLGDLFAFFSADGSDGLASDAHGFRFLRHGSFSHAATCHASWEVLSCALARLPSAALPQPPPKVGERQRAAANPGSNLFSVCFEKTKDLNGCIGCLTRRSHCACRARALYMLPLIS